MVERAGLENRCRRKSIESSNLSLSAKLRSVKTELRFACNQRDTVLQVITNQIVRIIQMWYGYILKSLIREFIYISSTNNLDRRLAEHNSGLVQSTKAYRPYEVDAYIAVKTELKARQLEKYFKIGSGKVILKKRIITDEIPQTGT